jgi:acyl-CoA dehydrogenase
MNFSFSSKVKDLQRRLQVFMDEHIYPNEQRYHDEIENNRWSPPAVIEELKPTSDWVELHLNIRRIATIPSALAAGSAAHFCGGRTVRTRLPIVNRRRFS